MLHQRNNTSLKYSLSVKIKKIAFDSKQAIQGLIFMIQHGVLTVEEIDTVQNVWVISSELA